MLPSLTNLSAIGAAPRGARLMLGDADDEHVKRSDQEFKLARAKRLTGSLLPYWMGLADSGRVARDKIVRIMNAHEGQFVRLPDKNPRSEAIVQELMQWGRDNESHALRCYQELTRFMIGLGSSRVRDTLANEQSLAERGQDSDEVRKVVEWSDVLGATPDAFVADVSQLPQHEEFGLLEIKCPAATNPWVDNMPRRHNVNMAPEMQKYGLLLQVWEQLEVVQGAKYVDLVKYKRTKPDLPADEYIWIGRLFRNDAAMARIKGLLQQSFAAFADALVAMQEDAEMTEDDDEGGARALEAWETEELTVRDGKGDEWLPRPVGSTCHKSDVRHALNAWCEKSLRFRDAGDEAGGFPWRTIEEVNKLGRDPDASLVKRFHLQSERAAIWDHGAYHDVKLAGGCMLRARDLWPVEFGT